MNIFELLCLVCALAPFVIGAVTANQVPRKAGSTEGSGPVAAVRIYEATFLFWNASGYLTNDDGGGLFPFAGISKFEVDNSGGNAGDKSIEFWAHGVFLLPGTGFSLATVGQDVFASDNFTLTLANTLVSYVGRIKRHQSSTLAWVEINAARGPLKVPQAVNQVHDTAPTEAELTTSFGAPASLGRGFIGTVDDNDGNTNFYIVAVSDASFFFLKMTKAT